MTLFCHRNQCTYQVNYDTVANATANTNSNNTTFHFLESTQDIRKYMSKGLHTNVHSIIINNSQKVEINPYAHQLAMHKNVV